MKMQKGRIPTQDDGWQFDCELDDGEMSWALYIKPQDHSQDWITLKLVANGKAERKANYWFCYNVNEDRFGFGRDVMSLQKHRPNLYKKVLDRFENI
jgi:hypothetical protein